jgi:hypothetical protein
VPSFRASRCCNFFGGMSARAAFVPMLASAERVSGDEPARGYSQQNGSLKARTRGPWQGSIGANAGLG